MNDKPLPIESGADDHYHLGADEHQSFSGELRSIMRLYGKKRRSKAVEFESLVGTIRSSVEASFELFSESGHILSSSMMTTATRTMLSQRCSIEAALARLQQQAQARGAWIHLGHDGPAT